MNFLAHLWLTDRAGLPLSGAILGDLLRGPMPAAMPEPLARSVMLHRRVDAHTDRHPRVVAARGQFGPGARRYSGILLDLLFDHVLAQDWSRYSDRALPDFAFHAGRQVGLDGAWFEHAGAPIPEPEPFSELLQSYATAPGIERAIRRVARRMRRPDGLLEAAAGWERRLAVLREDLPALLADLEHLEDPSLRSG
ncbi:MAG: ACP phosphodiesterase [Gammaproteobacteria bacterium]